MPENTPPAIGEIEPLDKPLLGELEALPQEATFFEGMKAGITAQPGKGVGHFIGAAIPAGVGGAMLAPVGLAPVGAALGEAARQAAGAVVAPEATAKKPPAQIGLEVALSGYAQKAGELAAPYMAPVTEKMAKAAKGASDWLSTRIGKGFLKASKTLNAYGHQPERALIDEGITATSWTELIDKTKAAKDAVGQQYPEVFKGAPEVNIYSALTPINTALREARKYPETNAGVINKLLSLKRDVIRRIQKSSRVVEEYEIKPSAFDKKWDIDIAQTFSEASSASPRIEGGKSVAKMGQEVGPKVSTEVWDTTIGVGKKAGKEAPEDILEAELVGRKRVMSAEEANNIKREIYRLTKYTGNPSDDAALNKTKQYVAAAINKEVEKAAPNAAPLNARYANLDALEKSAVHRQVVAERANIFGIPEFATAGVLLGGGGVPAAVATEVGGRLLGTPTGASAAIKGLSYTEGIANMSARIAQKIVERLGGGITAAPIEQALTEAFTPDAEQIKAEYKSGKISREDAAAMLREAHSDKFR